MHGPQHVVVPAAWVSDEKRVLDAPPGQAVFADGMGYKVVIGEDKVKEMVQTVVKDHVDVTNVRSQKSVRCVHARNSARVHGSGQELYFCEPGELQLNFRSLTALSFRMSGRTSSLMSIFSKSASQRSGEIIGQSEPNNILSFNNVLA